MDIWQVKNIKVKDLFPNKKNPRKISKENLKKLKSKIERLGFHNPVKVDEKMNLLGGNQRVKALLEMGAAELEIPVMIPNRPLTKKEKDEIIITDNVSDGEWDWDILKDEWNMEELKDWGLEWAFPEIDDCITDMPDLANGDKAPFQQMTFTLADEQAETVKEALEKAKKSENYKYFDMLGNENSNGNALFFIVSEWLNGKR